MDRNHDELNKEPNFENVALHPEGVDRNRMAHVEKYTAGVALHPEGVDRNCKTNTRKTNGTVALHPEGVDRNRIVGGGQLHRTASPSTRRAWIEIFIPRRPLFRDHESPSTRRAWIEIVDFNKLKASGIGRPPPGGRG